MEENEEVCYCCNNHKPSRYSNFYGVPICVGCHHGLVLMTWDGPSVEMVDKNREKMFSRVDRIKAALEKLGHEWNDPRGDKETPDRIYKDFENGVVPTDAATVDRLFPPWKGKKV